MVLSLTVAVVCASVMEEKTKISSQTWCTLFDLWQFDDIIKLSFKNHKTLKHCKTIFPCRLNISLLKQYCSGNLSFVLGMTVYRSNKESFTMSGLSGTISLEVFSNLILSHFIKCWYPFAQCLIHRWKSLKKTVKKRRGTKIKQKYGQNCAQYSDLKPNR